MTTKASNPAFAPPAAEAAAGALAALRREGLQLMQAGKFVEAVDVLGRARALDPGDAQIRLNLGSALQGARRHAEALEHFEQLQKSLPNDPAPFLHAAVSLLALGKAEAALEAANHARNRAPRLPQALFAYGQALMALDRPGEAEQAFAAALANAPAWADAWVHCGVARYRQGEIEGAKAAMRQALHHVPGHAAANTNLNTLSRLGGEAQANVPDAAQARTDPSPDRQAAPDSVTLSVWKPENPVVALGLAVQYLRRKPAFAMLHFGEWSEVLISQIDRGHFFFVADQRRQLHGFLGWALTHKHLVEEWVEGRAGLRNDECREGDYVIINGWAAENNRANRFIVDIARTMFMHKHSVYFKRHYPDGRTRPMRLATTFLESHFARAVVRHGNSAADTETGSAAVTDASPQTSRGGAGPAATESQA